LDLAVVLGESRLDIEVDGERYHKDWTGELCRRDLIRNHRLIELGWDVKRVWVHQVRDDLDGCVAAVRRWVEGHPLPEVEVRTDPESVRPSSPSNLGYWDNLDEGRTGPFCWTCNEDKFALDLEDCVACGSPVCFECSGIVDWVAIKKSKPTHGTGRICDGCSSAPEYQPCAVCGRVSKDGLFFSGEGSEGLCSGCYDAAHPEDIGTSLPSGPRPLQV